MSDELNASSDPKVAADEAWKAQVRAENAALDQVAAGGQAGADADPGASQIPPGDFLSLVQMFATQALVALGVVPHPASGKAEPQLPLARHFIDLLGIIEEKTAGNLTAEEKSLLEGTLHSLRMTYLELTRQTTASGKAAT